jgi:hypothetical protein
LNRPVSGIALNNQGMGLRLLDDSLNLIDEVEYEQSGEGESYARGENGKWFWTSQITPGEKNAIILTDNGKNVAINQVKGVRLIASLNSQDFVETSLEKIRDLEVGDKVRVRGTVAVEPSVLGAQIFYIVGSSGIQIYNYKKDFPRLRVGDYLEIVGVLAQNAGELRIKTTNKEDMKVLEKKNKPLPQNFSCAEMDEESVGQLIKITGVVTERKSSVIYFDDGSNEALVYIKTATGVDAKSFIEGAEYAITGIVGTTQSGIRLLPRSIDDIILISANQEEASTEEAKVLGEVPVNDNWSIDSRDKRQEAEKYYLLIAIMSGVVLIGWMIKKYYKIK